MLTLFVAFALLVGGLFAGELVRGQCRRMLSRPHPSVFSVSVAARGEAVAATEQAVQA